MTCASLKNAPHCQTWRITHDKRQNNSRKISKNPRIVRRTNGASYFSIVRGSCFTKFQHGIEALMKYACNPTNSQFQHFGDLEVGTENNYSILLANREHNTKLLSMLTELCHGTYQNSNSGSCHQGHYTFLGNCAPTPPPKPKLRSLSNNDGDGYQNVT